MSKGRKAKAGVRNVPEPPTSIQSTRHPITLILGRVQLRSDGSGVLQPLESKVGPVYLPPEELGGVGPETGNIITSVGRKGKLKKIIEVRRRPVVSVGVVERRDAAIWWQCPCGGRDVDNPPRRAMSWASRYVKVTKPDIKSDGSEKSQRS